eukprot:CAMPEP_0114540700 /NCGR_PEP_ID=MMETSP0114-20121206/915_1 /TAXON_ID=31324 /ORGANISM="Goniomonas sp, Strain m" /LENGTH=875 /DNA_ID=CAMNT_0001724895 /DNA_START=1 /DNA_END=2629 /DNA_ORIENTATION=+
MLVHTEVAKRAQHVFQTFSGYDKYNDIIEKHQNAFQAGAPYPDWGYMCKSPVGDPTHWPPFMLNATKFVHENYPQPWDSDTEKLVAFLMGVESHCEADVIWHWGHADPYERSDKYVSGFLRTMSHTASTCNDVWDSGPTPDCHDIGDTGGDMTLAYEGAARERNNSLTWYVPVHDLAKVYTMMGFKVSAAEIAAVFYIAIHAERVGGGFVGPFYWEHTPFLGEQLTEWFNGGFDNMALATVWKWRGVASLLDGNSTLERPGGFEEYTERLNHDVALPHAGPGGSRLLQLATDTGLRVEDNGRGVHLSLSSLDPVTDSGTGLHMDTETSGHLRRALSYLNRPTPSPASDSADGQEPGRSANTSVSGFPDMVEKIAREWWGVIEANVKEDVMSHVKDLKNVASHSASFAHSYAGRSVAVGDLNGDSIPDTVVGAPGWNGAGVAMAGAVFVIYGGHAIEGHEDRLEVISNITLTSNTTGARFGTAVALVDINQDGLLDVAASSPNLGQWDGNLSLWEYYEESYNGRVDIFLGQPGGGVSTIPDIIILPDAPEDPFTNLGMSLAAGDCNGDGHLDLLIGSPYASELGYQRGQAAVVLARNTTLPANATVSTVANMVVSGVDYEWLGNAMSCAAGHVAISAPGSRPSGLQGEGAVYLFDSPSLADVAKRPSPLAKISSGSFMSQLGQSVAFSTDGAVLALGAPSYNGERNRSQAGGVMLVPVAGLSGEVWLTDGYDNVTAIAKFCAVGMQPFARFGWSVLLTDMDGDGNDDLVVSEPFRITAIDGAEEGAIYIWTDIHSRMLANSGAATCADAGAASVRLDHHDREGRFGSALAAADVTTSSSKGKDLVVGGHMQGEPKGETDRGRQVGGVHLLVRPAMK